MLVIPISCPKNIFLFVIAEPVAICLYCNVIIKQFNLFKDKCALMTFFLSNEYFTIIVLNTVGLNGM